MSRIILSNLKIENFKGIDHYELNLDGDNAVITAENGVGKTTVYDALLFLFFGKDSTGRKDFQLRPLDRYNRPVKGVVLAVEATIDIDGVKHVFRKEHHEKVVKNQLRGYETLCWIDEVPRKVGEYAEYIADIVSEDTFKLLTDLRFFNSKMHHTDRRKVLLEIAGEIGTPEGFEELTAALNNRTVEQYKTVLQGQKKRHAKERDEINPRIDELLKGMIHPTGDTTEMALRRDKLETEIQQLKIDRQGIDGQEQERQKKINAKNLLIVEQKKREGDLANDTSGVKALMDEKAVINTNVYKAGALLGSTVNELSLAKAKMTGLNNETTSLLASLNTIRTEYKAVEEEPKASTCYACKQTLPTDMVERVESERKAKLEEITQRGNDLNEKVKENKLKVYALDADILDLNKKLEKAKTDSQITLGKAEKRVTEIEEAIKTRPTPVPQEDEKWLELDGQIQEIDAELGDPVADQLEAIETQRTAKETERDGLNKELAQADRIEQDKQRIALLELREKELAQLIADLEKQLADIDRYEKTVSTLITSAVNGKFKVTEFKLFKELLNGGLEPCCEATLKGVPYPDMSSGQQIYVGIDIINVLSEHYGVSVPLFIDHSESMTLPIESHSQTIELCAVKGVKQLQVQTKTSAKERQVA